MKDAQQGQELASETIQSWQAKRRETGYQQYCRQHRNARGKATEVAQAACPCPRLDEPRDQKQRSNSDAVVHHLQDRSLDALHIEGQHTQHDYTQVADAGITEQALDVILHQRQHSTVENTDHRQNIEERRERMYCVGKERYAVA